MLQDGARTEKSPRCCSRDSVTGNQYGGSVLKGLWDADAQAEWSGRTSMQVGAQSCHVTMLEIERRRAQSDDVQI
jgi:hypothetical protein